MEEPQRQFPECFVRLIEGIHAKAPEGQFDYQKRDRAALEREREEHFTHCLKELGVWIDPQSLETVDTSEGSFPVEASVVIPVRNRVATIADAVRSALDQRTDFPYNIIVVDNHSTDGTPEAVEALARGDSRVVLLRPDDTTLSIGGCWNEALDSELCGRFAVQLDSDDLYSGPDTLQRIVDTMRAEGAAMLAGAYRLVDMQLRELSPGVIAHEEWTAGNGHNNLLRVNGVGAPRAFYTPVARRFRFWDVGYGEDYAMALDISGKYRVARIRDVLYLCRRWEGNSDASETPELHEERRRWKDNARLEAMEMRALRNMRRGDHPVLNLWLLRMLQQAQEGIDPAFADATAAAEAPRNKWVEALGTVWHVLQLGHRAPSTDADVAPGAIAARPCFLCPENRPSSQMRINWGGYHFLLNPRPVLPGQITVAADRHAPQRLTRQRIHDMCAIAARTVPMTVFFNAEGAGASAPDHFHFQMVDHAMLPGLDDGPGAIRFAVTTMAEGVDTLERHLATLPEQRFNLFCTYRSESASWHFALWPRRAHRPRNYPVTGISPGALEMAGVVVVTTADRFKAVDSASLAEAMREVMLLPVAEP